MILPQHDPVIEAAIRDMPGEEELRQAGANYLELLRGGRTGGEEGTIERWERVDRCKPWMSEKIVLITLLAILIGWAVVFDVGEIYSVFAVKDRFSEHENAAEAAEGRLSPKLDVAQRRLLYGDVSKADEISRRKGIFQSDPDNPAYFSEYALACLAGNEPLPADFLATARRIDPDNAWFTHLAAAAEAGDCVKSKLRKSHMSGGRRIYTEPMSWDIVDRARLDRALSIFREGRLQKKYETYFSETLRKRLAILSQGTRQEVLDSMSYLGTVRFPGDAVRPIGKLIAARAWLAGIEKNEADLKAAAMDAESLIGTALETEPGVMIELMVNRYWIFLMIENIRPACDLLGLADEAGKWNQIESRFEGWLDAEESNGLTVDGVVVPHRLKTGGFHGLDALDSLSGWLPINLSLTDADIAPSRYLDHEYFSHASCYVAAALLGVISVVLSLYWYSTRKVMRGLARQMKRQMRPVDWALMSGIGVVLPFVLVIGINRFTPFGGREYGLKGSMMMLPGGHFFALVVLWLLVPVCLVHWRLGKRLRIFGFGNWNRWWTGVAIGCAVGFLFAIKWVATTGTIPELWVEKLDFPDIQIEGRPISEAPLWIAVGIISVPVLWMVFGAGAALLGATHRTLHRVTAVRILVPLYVGAMVLCLSAIPFFQTAEKYWLVHDVMNRFDPALPSWSRYEYRAAVVIRGELREIMGYDAAPFKNDNNFGRK